MAEKNSAADPVRSQDIRSVKTKQDRDGEPVTHTAAAEDGDEPETGQQEEQEQSEDKL